MSLSNGFDTGSDQLGTSSLNAPVRGDGSHSNVDAAFRYTHTTRSKRTLTITASDALRYQPNLQQVLASSYQSSVGFASPLWRRGKMDLNQSVAYTPYYQLELFPTLPPDAGALPQALSSDYAVSKQSAYTYTTGIGYTRDLGRRSALQAGYELRSVTFDDASRNLLTETVSARLARRTSRSVRLHIGAATRSGRYGQTAGADRTRTQELEIGLDYSRRGTTLKVASGSTFFPEGGKTGYRMTGNALLQVGISRTWNATAQYNRALRFIEAFSYPFFADSVSIGVGGQPARRLHLGTSVGYSSGEIGVSAEGGAFRTYTGSAQITVPLTRHYAFYSEYLYYRYRFTERAFADAFPPRLNRHTVRAGLKLWFPILN